MRAREIELEGFVDNSWFIKNLKSTEKQMLRGCSEQFYLHSYKSFQIARPVSAENRSGIWVIPVKFMRCAH